MTNKDEDPFDCFGSMDDEEDDNKDNVMDEETRNYCPVKRVRELDCGVLSFHPSTESSLLVHVRNVIQQQQQWSSNGKDSDDSRKPYLVVCNAINEYCEERHWMMHVGPEKGQIVTQTLYDCIMEKKNNCKTWNEDFVCVELGTYCGYASILLADILKKISTTTTLKKPKLFTVEINPTFQKIAMNLVNLAQLQDYVTFLSVDLNFDGTTQNVATLLQEEIKNSSGLKKIDFLFIDHDKDLYLHDLQLLERQGLIQSGTIVVADNVVFAKIDDYINYMKQLSKQNIVSTQTIPAHVEYSSQQQQDETNLRLLQDGIEITKYLKSPHAGLPATT
eukprot:CAMPEP_0197828422 /NCGR_PEP_ID=MMETSP1437-20131217/4984_1 /TAXON_ID=49252 ORGANISM="Eucampia antarctica, Strain CCMP1452" /NCGR_SAMPLE_ID=MMETSP1437 /ASSEMBLY_ACC=CAM_ASM_001096 /LENGTH=332 /DNA_ID=CAMNT_0043429617 /DNA_START=36 /DNA_END=1034 /DNA_ORIENTATION=-